MSPNVPIFGEGSQSSTQHLRTVASAVSRGLRQLCALWLIDISRGHLERDFVGPIAHKQTKKHTAGTPPSKVALVRLGKSLVATESHILGLGCAHAHFCRHAMRGCDCYSNAGAAAVPTLSSRLDQAVQRLQGATEQGIMASLLRQRPEGPARTWQQVALACDATQPR